MKTKHFTVAMAAALALAACDKNNDNFNIDNLKDTPITIASAGVAELIATRAADTNPLVGTSDSPATMGVFVTGGSEDKYDATNVQWKHVGTSWENQETTMLYEGELSEQKIYAYSPYDANATAGTITVTAGGTTDLLVATTTDLTSSSVSLTMTHALAKLVLNVSGYGSEVSEADREISKVTVDNMYASGTLNISDNTWSGLSEANATLTMTDNELLVIPMASCTSFPIEITLADTDNRVFGATVDLSKVNNQLAAGTQYTINLTVGQDKVTVGGITADKWASTEGGQLATE